MPTTSIIMTYYKKSKYIYRTIKSILNQSHKNFEVIIVNDEINAESNKILNNIANLDKRIKIIKNKFNLGAGRSRNLALNYAKGTYVAFCDCDDIWSVDKLKKQIQLMKEKKLNFCFTAYNIIDTDGKLIGYRNAPKNIDYLRLLNSCDIGLSTVVIKKSIFRDKSLRFGKTKTKEDYILWLLIARKRIKFYGINQRLVSWRKTQNSLSSSTTQKLIDGFKVYRVYMGYGIIKSLIFIIILSLNYLRKKINK